MAPPARSGFSGPAGPGANRSSASNTGGESGKSGSRSRKSRSSSRRRRIQADLQAKTVHSKESWELQQLLLTPGAGPALLDAAKRLLPGEGYAAVVEERALEGICGYPPCANEAAGSEGKRWTINIREHEVLDQEELGRFCSRECMRASSAFSLQLFPDPVYCRPASAIAATRSAIAEVSEAAGAVASTARGAAVADDTAAQPEGVAPQQPPDQAGAATPGGPGPCPRKLPEVRRKAVVRFSRTHQTYSVDYGAYDGGGALPEVASTATEAGADEAPPRAATRDADTVTVSRLLDAPILERPSAGATGGGASPAQETEEEGAPISGQPAGPPCPMTCKAGSTAPGQSRKAARAAAREGGPSVRGEEEAGKCPAVGDSDDDNDAASAQNSGDESDDDFLEPESTYPTGWSHSPFVRAWGVLTNWLSDTALAVLRGARPERREDVRPAHKGRRDLLMEMLSARLPAGLCFLAPRYHDVTSVLSVHQTLPSVTESDLYDLLAVLILRAINRVEVQRGHLGQSSDSTPLLDKYVADAARRLGIGEEELETLDAMLV